MPQLEPETVEAATVDPVEVATGETQAAEPDANEPAAIDAMYPDDTGPEAPSEDADVADDDDDDGNGDDDEAGVAETAPPAAWNAEDRQLWGKLTPDAQAVILRREAEAHKAITEKGREVANVKNDVLRQAESEVAAFRERQAAEYQQLAARFMPQQPNPELLYTGNPADAVTYQQQRALFEAQTSQQQQLQQRAQAESAEAQRIRESHEQAWKQEQSAALAERLPQWFDPEAGPKLHKELQSIGVELGYPNELMAEASADDIMALKTAAEWKSDAQKWRAYQKSRRKPDGTFKSTRQLPPIAKPNAARPAGNEPANQLSQLYPND